MAKKKKTELAEPMSLHFNPNAEKNHFAMTAAGDTPPEGFEQIADEVDTAHVSNFITYASDKIARGKKYDASGCAREYEFFLKNQ